MFLLPALFPAATPLSRLSLLVDLNKYLCSKISANRSQERTSVGVEEEKKAELLFCSFGRPLPPPTHTSTSPFGAEGAREEDPTYIPGGLAPSFLAWEDDHDGSPSGSQSALGPPDLFHGSLAAWPLSIAFSLALYFSILPGFLFSTNWHLISCCEWEELGDTLLHWGIWSVFMFLVREGKVCRCRVGFRVQGNVLVLDSVYS